MPEGESSKRADLQQAVTGEPGFNIIKRIVGYFCGQAPSVHLHTAGMMLVLVCHQPMKKKKRKAGHWGQGYT